MKIKNLALATVAVVAVGCDIIGKSVENKRESITPTTTPIIIPTSIDEYIRFACQENPVFFNTDSLPVISSPDSTINANSMLNALRNFQLIAFTDVANKLTHQQLVDVLNDIARQFENTPAGHDVLVWANDRKVGTGASTSPQMFLRIFDLIKAEAIDCRE